MNVDGNFSFSGCEESISEDTEIWKGHLHYVDVT